jgi:cell division protein FtsZ
MIDINRSMHLGEKTADNITIKIVGLGGAGSNALDRIVLDGVDSADLVAMNSDVQALTGSVAMEKVQLGREATRGLGAGGDPELGASAAEESINEIRAALEGAQMIFLCVGLGGGTGSGAAPLVASLAKAQGALVVAFTTMPFAFEGKRRRQQAADALASIEREADAVICFENDKMGDAVAPGAGVHQAFASADLTLSQSVRAIAGIFKKSGLIHIGFDDLRAALENHGARSVFGFGEADGDNRANEALARALKNPLMDRGRMLGDARSVLVNICGGPDMTLNEVQILMDELGKHIADDAQIRFGTSVDRAMGNRMSVTIISSVAGEVAPAAAPKPAVAKPAVRPARATVEKAKPVSKIKTKPEPEPVKIDDEIETEPETVLPVKEPVIEAKSEEISAAPLFDKAEPKPVAKTPTPAPLEKPAEIARPPLAQPRKISIQPEPQLPAAPVMKAPQQETLQFESLTRGRFEKSERTIVDGEDLDVPTYMRRNVKLK